jgi:hypothetical protein
MMPPPCSCAFDLLELDGEDLRCTPIEERKRILAKLLSHPHEGIAFNEHYTGDGAIIFRHACALGCEGIVSKRLGSPARVEPTIGSPPPFRHATTQSARGAVTADRSTPISSPVVCCGGTGRRPGP